MTISCLRNQDLFIAAFVQEPNLSELTQWKKFPPLIFDKGRSRTELFITCERGVVKNTRRSS